MTTAARARPPADPSDLLGLSRQVRDARRALNAHGLATAADLPELRVVVLGAGRNGKTTFVRALLGDAADQLGAVLEPPGRRLPVPVEFSFGPSTTVRSMVESRNGLRVHPGVASGRGARGGRLVRVHATAPAGLLDAWGMQMVDTPTPSGTDGWLDHLSDLLTPECVVVYLVSSRGPAEDDVRALDDLRGRPLVVLQNLRESEVDTFDEPITPSAVPGAVGDVAWPVILPRLDRPGPERDLLAVALGELRRRLLPPAQVFACADAVRAAHHQLGRRHAGEVARSTATILGAPPVERWRGVAELLALEARGPALVAAADTLGTARRALGHAATVLETALDPAPFAQAVTDGYNVRAAGRSAFSTWTPPEEGAFGHTLAEHRDALCGLLDRLANDTGLRLSDQDRAGIRGIRDQVVRDRLEVVLVGQFSAGKSSLVNALLSRDGEDVLPVHVGPTTATLNHLSFGETTSLTPRWVDPGVEPLELTLLHTAQDTGRRSLWPGQAPSERFRVHAEEIRALATWLATGVVAPEDCTFTTDPDGVTTREAVDALRQLRADIEYATPSPAPAPGSAAAPASGGSSGRSFHDFIYARLGGYHPKFTSGVIPLRCTVRAFRAEPPPVAVERPYTALETISTDPALALRIESVQLTVPHPLLRHLTVIDTPGTDAPVPRHRICTENAINKDRRRAVIYCFSGMNPAAVEDARNMEALRSSLAGGTDASRYFFVITKKGLVPPRDQVAVREEIGEALRRYGASRNNVYFTEVRNGLNDEFLQFAAALSAFGVQSKKPLLRDFVQDARAVVVALRDLERRMIKDMDADEDTRRRDREGLERAQRSLAEIRSAMKTSPEWGEPWARRRTRLGELTAVVDLGRDLHGLHYESMFAPFVASLAGRLRQVNRAADERVTGTWSALAGQVSALIGSRLPGRTVSPSRLYVPGDLVPTGELLNVAQNLEWRGRWRRFWDRVADGTDRKQDVDDNRERLVEAWRRALAGAERTASGLVGQALADTDGHLQRLADALRAEAGLLDQARTEQGRAQACAGRDRAQQWVELLDSMDRRIKRMGR